jgi:signal transduction histidine kinase
MNLERPGIADNPAGQADALDPEGNKANRRLRVVLLASFGSLLVFLLYSGTSALQTLRKLHELEESARHEALERERVLATVIISTNTYSDRVEEFLLSPQQTEEDANGEIAKRADAALTALRSYPADRNPEEQSLIEQLQKYLAEQDGVIQGSKDWKPEERRSRAQQVISERIIPRRQQFVAIAQRIELINDSQTVTAEQGAFLQFDRLQNRLVRMLLLALTTGLLLAIGSALYILHLERQGALRYAELAHSRLELQELSTRLVDAQETERRSLSHELHDQVGQALGLLLLDAGRLSKQLASGDDKSQEIVQRIKTLAEGTLHEVRNIALLLRPSMLDDLGLVAAVEWYAREMSRRGKIEVEVRSESVTEDLADELKICVYRVVQEALNNAQRHAHAKNVEVALVQADSAIRVKITDDGSGFDTKRTRGMGLLGMEERVKRLGGRITVDSQPSAGTKIEVELPLAGTKASDTDEKNQNPTR